MKASLPAKALSGWVRISPQSTDYMPLALGPSTDLFWLPFSWALMETAPTMLSLLMLWIPSVWVRLSPQLLGLLM